MTATRRSSSSPLRVVARLAACVVAATGIATSVGAFAAVAPPTTARAPAAADRSTPATRVLDDFHDVSAWRASASDDVEARVEQVGGGGLRLRYDFRGKGGYAVARRSLSTELPDDYEIDVRVRGTGAANDLQLKLVDASGDNVWWFPIAGFEPTAEWRTLRIRRRQIEFAWGTTTDRTLRRFATIEFAVAAASGGRGALEFADLTLRRREPAPRAWPEFTARATSARHGAEAAAALDGRPGTAWRPARGDRAPTWTVDLGTLREFGAVTYAWRPDAVAADYDVDVSMDGLEWTRVRAMRGARTPVQSIALPESEARYVRLRFAGTQGRHAALDGFTLEPLEVGASPNAFVTHVAARHPRGAFPRAYAGEQSYWTIVGTDGGADEGMLSEDGAFELRKAAPSLEPFVVDGGRAFSWADVSVSHSLRDGYLPMPGVEWQGPGWRLRTTAFGAGEPDRDFAVVRYELRNDGDAPRDLTLAVAVRPLQVNPPTQFLNGAGGVAPIRRLDWDARRLRIDERHTVVPLVAPDAFHAATFDAAPTPAALLATTAWPGAQPAGAAGPARSASPDVVVEDEARLASAAFVYRVRLPGRGAVTFAFVVPWTTTPDLPSAATTAQWAEDVERRTAAYWHGALDRFAIRGPTAVRPIFDTLRTAIAHLLINRDGARLQPGSRSYERSWIRDGALESKALLMLGHEDVAGRYLDWYAERQFANGKIPCCVDDRGADPVPENDSDGEFIWLAGELDRHTNDDAALRRRWPRVQAALEHLETLRLSERIDAHLTGPTRAFYGLLPASISHEGYSAKPMHSYWDAFWGLAGYDAGVRLAQRLGDTAAVRRWSASRDQFRADVHASLRAAMEDHRIDYLPGCAELGDLDPTSTTIALSPVGEQSRLPPAALRATFDRYWRDFEARRAAPPRDGAYAPYELRVVGTYVRLGQPARAREALEWFMHDRRPAAWNQWGEVVPLDARRPHFVGDMPHGWVASDFVRSALDLFAYERDDDATLVLAAGIAPEWLDGDGIALAGVRTHWGTLGYSLRREAPGRYRLQVDAGATPPGGFVVVLDGVERRIPGDATIVHIVTSDATRADEVRRAK